MDAFDDQEPSPLPDFVPVPRKTISHGWTAAKQRGFIEALATTGSVRMATEAVGMSHCGVYKLRTAPGSASFVAAWDAAVAIGAKRIRDVLIDHAIHGVPETVVIGKDMRIERRRFNHRTMIWALQHHMPETYPGGSTLAARPAPKPGERLPSADEVRAEILRKLAVLRRPWLIAIARDRARRAAYALLYPNQPQDWDRLAAEGLAAPE